MPNSSPPATPDPAPDASAAPSPESHAASLLRLVLLPGLGPVRVGRVLDAFGGSVDRALGASAAAWQAVPGIGATLARRVLEGVRTVEALAAEELERADRAGVRLVARGGPGYPPLLAELRDAPAVLYVRGSLEPAAADRYPVAIVGSRRCTAYGIEQAERFAGVLGRSGLTIVSGGARGIDTAAHRGALRSGGRTVSVQGAGLGRCYPPENADLYERIVADGRGAVVSELPMLTEPKGEQFPARNRIISGMSLGVLVIEAGAKSGALITARLAVEEHGREVMVVPGRVDSSASAGSLSILKSGGGALVTEPGDVIDALEAPARFVHDETHADRYADPAVPRAGTGPSPETAAGLFGSPSPAATAAGGVDLASREADPADVAVLSALANGPLALDTLAGASGLTAEALRVRLTLLELSGRIRREGGRVRRASP